MRVYYLLGKMLCSGAATAMVYYYNYKRNAIFTGFSHPLLTPAMRFSKSSARRSGAVDTIGDIARVARHHLTSEDHPSDEVIDFM